MFSITYNFPLSSKARSNCNAWCWKSMCIYVYIRIDLIYYNISCWGPFLGVFNIGLTWGGWDITSPPWQLLNPEGTENGKHTKPSKNRHSTRVDFPWFPHFQTNQSPNATARSTSLDFQRLLFLKGCQRFHEKVTWLAGLKEPASLVCHPSFELNCLSTSMSSALFLLTFWSLEVVKSQWFQRIHVSGLPTASQIRNTTISLLFKSVKNLIATNGQLCSLCM